VIQYEIYVDLVKVGFDISEVCRILVLVYDVNAKTFVKLLYRKNRKGG
jgi:hypothetical protein